ncbi:MAG: TolC family protein [candidate division Zixibacteria bacterium]|nr:TolC family protein [candidate division Zixibacteria bacterium]
MTRIIVSALCLSLILTNLCGGQVEPVSPRMYSLDECIQLAEKHNANLIAAAQSYKAAKSRVWTGWGALLPRLDSDLSYSRTVYGPSEFPRYDPLLGKVVLDTVGVRSSKGYRAQISAGQSWSLGGYNFYQIKEYNASRSVAKNEYELQRQELILNVKQAYFDVLKAKMLLEIQKEALRRASEQLKIAQTRYELGAASFSDVLKAKVQYGDAELALINADNSLKLAKARLNSWMGQNVDSPIDVEENLTVPEFDYSYENAVKESMKQNPRVKRAQSDLRAAEAYLGMTRSGFFPNLNLSGSYSWSNPELDQLKYIRERDYSWSLSASVSLNIFDNFGKNYNLSWAKAARNSKREDFSQTKREVALELKQAFLNVQQANEKINLTKEKVKSAREDLDLVQEKYNLGAANILELLDAEVSFKQAEADQVEALYDYNLAVAQFEKAMGR